MALSGCDRRGSIAQATLRLADDDLVPHLFLDQARRHLPRTGMNDAAEDVDEGNGAGNFPIGIDTLEAFTLEA